MVGDIRPWIIPINIMANDIFSMKPPWITLTPNWRRTKLCRRVRQWLYAGLTTTENYSVKKKKKRYICVATFVNSCLFHVRTTICIFQKTKHSNLLYKKKLVIFYILVVFYLYFVWFFTCDHVRVQSQSLANEVRSYNPDATFPPYVCVCVCIARSRDSCQDVSQYRWAD